MNTEPETLELTEENLLDGCYHEMGHVLASLISFPGEPRVQAIQFSLGKKESFSDGFRTIYHRFQWNLPEEWGLLCLCNMSGGVFQQMKRLYRELKDGTVRLNLAEKAVGLADHDKAVMLMFRRLVKSQIPGMEEDLKEIRSYYQKCHDRGLVDGALNLERMKYDAIMTLFPYVNDQRVDDLCNRFCHEVLTKKTPDGVVSRMHIETIMYALNWSS